MFDEPLADSNLPGDHEQSQRPDLLHVERCCCASDSLGTTTKQHQLGGRGSILLCMQAARSSLRQSTISLQAHKDASVAQPHRILARLSAKPVLSTRVWTSKLSIVYQSQRIGGPGAESQHRIQQTLPARWTAMDTSKLRKAPPNTACTRETGKTLCG